MSDADAVRESALPLEYLEDLDPLMERIGDARCVLLGEASHGTHEYYAWRAALTKRLITERGFSFVAVEGDWPDCWAVNASVTRAEGAPADPGAVLDGYRRWPTWMWANQETVNFCRWLRDHNDGPEVGFYGLDVYSLWDSLRAIITHLADHRPEYVETALDAYRCFQPYGEDPRSYAWNRLVPGGCEEEVLALLTRLRRTGGADPAGDLNARQNAEVAAGAERYYRAMLGGGPDAWNLRDTHMADTLDRLLDFHGPGARGVVWAHNTHIGDARATSMAASGMVNLGQLARERMGRDRVVAVGFAGGHGEVIAAPRWGDPMERMTVPGPPPDSAEAMLEASGVDSGLFVFADRPAADWFGGTRGHRAIGVVYDPTRDRRNYVPTRLADRYDALCWFRRTSALEPLHMEAAVRYDEMETVPSGV
ncbi:erythromycin esterase family protein [Spirillospora sp. NPDC029432]|uniref:erythromycin esterase family protein n=1 Tax=Spirillospora sp. NPDC029432 TaxID=3154599 RepID=UPI0034530B49